MSEVPSLVTLCIGVIKDEILDENDNLSYVYKLPSELFDCILPHLPPLALQNLQEAMPSVSCNDHGSSDDCFRTSRKRKRFENFNIAWKALYISRWPVVQKGLVNQLPEDVQQNESTTNWQQNYWERHLQNCLDAAAEIVSIPYFDGCLGEVQIPDVLLKCISYEGHLSRSRSHSKLAYHCHRFSLYARCLRLQNVHCVAEISHLIRKSPLQSLEMHWIKSKEQVTALCELLEQNRETLASLEFVHCKFPAALITEICDSLHIKGFDMTVIKNFSIKRSSFLDSSSFPLPLGLKLLLSAARGLTSLILSDNRLWWRTAKMVFDTLLDTESNLQVLDLSGNNISGWLSHFKWGSPSYIKSDREIGKSLKTLRVLNLRNNSLHKDDADCLKYALAYMPNLEVLNLSENPIQDEGIRNLSPYLVSKSEQNTPLAELYLENCEISCFGASKLLEVLSPLKVQLKSLSIGDNHLSSKFGASLGKFLGRGIQAINIKGIGLGSSGFSDAKKQIVQELNLIRINISNNCGGIETANFMSNIISRAPELVSVNAGNNWMGMESLPVIFSCLKVRKGKLEHIDLTGNHLCNKHNIASLLAEFQVNGKPKITLSSPSASDALYDNDP